VPCKAEGQPGLGHGHLDHDPSLLCEGFRLLVAVGDLHNVPLEHLHSGDPTLGEPEDSHVPHSERLGVGEDG